MHGLYQLAHTSCMHRMRTCMPRIVVTERVHVHDPSQCCCFQSTCECLHADNDMARMQRLLAQACQAPSGTGTSTTPAYLHTSLMHWSAQ